MIFIIDIFAALHGSSLEEVDEIFHFKSDLLMKILNDSFFIRNVIAEIVLHLSKFAYLISEFEKNKFVKLLFVGEEVGEDHRVGLPHFHK